MNNPDALSLSEVALQAQSCFVQEDDATGSVAFSTAQLAELEAAACSLRAVFPEEFQADFAVYDFGFYLHQESYVGGTPQVFQDKIAKIEQQTPYFLVFGRQLLRGGALGKVWVEVRLPETGFFECFEEEEMDGLLVEFNRFLGRDSGTSLTYISNEIAVMERLTEVIEKLEACCYADSGFRSASLNSEDIEITVCIDECMDEEEGTEGYISSAPTMPAISFSVDFIGLEDEEFCSSLNAVLEITYQRVPDTAPGRARDDTLTSKIDGVMVGGISYVFEFDNIQLWGRSWPQVGGGRAKLKITDALGVELKSFGFMIKGTNPYVEEVINYLDSKPYDEIWFFKKLVMHESGTNTDNGIGAEALQFNSFDANHDNLLEDWNAYSRCPNLSYDGGWGLCQHTNPVPHKQSLWDWKVNIHEAYHRLAEDPISGESGTKYSAVKSKLRGMLSTVENWETNNPGLEIEGHEDFEHGGVTWVHGMSNIMENIEGLEEHFDEDVDDGERSFIDAMLMKAYNGVGTTGSPDYDKHFYYLYYDDESPEQVPEWRIDVDAHYGDSVNRYVEDVSETTVPN